jgi:hypothetical protein
MWMRYGCETICPTCSLLSHVSHIVLDTPFQTTVGTA